MRGLPHNFRCGDWVYDQVDPRHVGRIKVIIDGIWAVIKWDETGLESELRLSHLCKTEDPN